MRALVLAAGRGQRLRPRTDVTPKPLLPVGEHLLCEWQLAALKKAGITQVVMNTAHLASCFEPMPARWARHGLTVQLSQEGTRAEQALESLGGIVQALPLLSPDGAPFLVLAGDVVHDFPLERLVQKAQSIEQGRIDAHLVAVPNPDFHTQGDMTVHADGRIVPGTGPHTYACLMVVSPRLFASCEARAAKLFPWLWQFAQSGRMTGEVSTCFWGNIGSEQEYAKLCADVRAQALLAQW